MVLKLITNTIIAIYRKLKNYIQRKFGYPSSYYMAGPSHRGNQGTFLEVNKNLFMNIWNIIMPIRGKI